MCSSDLELGIDLIITDHHEVTGELPEAHAVINPKNPQDEYPFPFLTGVGVAYKLVQALGLTGYEKWLLALVATRTVPDSPRSPPPPRTFARPRLHLPPQPRPPP